MSKSAAVETVEELARKGEEVRARVQGEKPAPAEDLEQLAAAGSDPTTREKEALCPDCEERWEYSQLQVTGPTKGKPEGVWLPPTTDVKRCPRCEAEAKAAEAEAARQAEKESAERRARMRAEDVLRYLERAGVNGTEHRDSTLDSFDPSESGPTPLEHARDFLRRTSAAQEFDQVRGLYLFGTTGCGKTHLAVSICRELMLADGKWTAATGIVFDDALELITRIQDTYNTGSSTWGLIEQRIRARLWVLDDLGSEQPSPDVVRRLTLILNRRALRPTIVTGNYSPEEFETRAEDFFRIGSRLGPQYFDAVPVAGRDRRHDPS